ncbi:oxysterol-binding protein-related protein 7 isoform X1 [Neophocaena asiaeorientalis asiaeorientalis]|uniref:Oxysterol-binding protein n=1 Tax=Neophocaena asiaeorientalis asiaeorientalis TaxID=1706337 RepID=A0A341BFS0_NEOAA|nr:oxysterol-binding protein-related protein 7 isoform X1 [Neophocaena asiaeorientalis asiaeorientalis]XP_024600545.1 oxysterol-binding protein-related protein 7 isoform X1 [Neophocaena asiaeorientalis asiaeorientalis]XP_024600552.1 oxysterol-binding protein-related protein 7 isoform X1 [Neophocaena asiaeorientalis asiaeorientalis]XP_024600559.1 oxysterol-binding protein-related protein 7 isoform X1 [Neophocaena asiaeorientalis asiaeorientalis]
MDFQERDPPSLAESTQSAKPSSAQQASELWEVVEEPQGRLGAEGIMPERQEGHLLKKRKWPLKGWHKRYFVLEDGILHYATTRQDITKGKLHGSIDVRLSVMSINKKAQRIDLDTEDNIYHLKIKSQDLFQSWVAQLRAHRLAQHLDVPRSLLPSTTHRKVPGAQLPAAGSASALPGVGPREKVSSWLRDSDGLDRCSHELSECQGKLQELHRLLQSLESLPRIPSAPVIPTHQASVTTERPKKGKRTSRMWCTQSFAKDDTIGRVGRLHGSVPNLSRYLESRDPSGPRGLPPPDYAHVQRSFWALAQKVHSSLSSVLAALTTERDRLRDLHQGSEPSRLGVRLGAGWPVGGAGPSPEDCRPGGGPGPGPGREVGGGRLCPAGWGGLHPPRPGTCALTLSLQVSEAAAGPRRLHSLSVSSDTTADSFSSLNPEEQEALYMKGRELTPQLSQSSVLSLADSHTEFFDACEVLLSASSSENEASEEEELCTSEVTTSLSEEVLDLRGAERCQKGGAVGPPRRQCLPAASGPGADVSLWNILWNNIGKDLSKVSMPVQLNEPLSTLQRLCEELEYSSLLDQASQTTDPCERMVYIAAFAVSAYSSTYHRAGCKPFNPVLGETYECERPDRGFRFISEQVSHHPPISACHAESENFIFWQDMKWKNKFWGKSLEIVPVGMVNVSLPRFGDHFEWNKVTSCIHNILSGQRWIEHYGEVLIRNTQDSSCHCKITFCKAKYWSSNVHEVQGAVFSRSGRVLHRLFGKWPEGLYRGPPPGGQCIWKPNSMPPNYERNFGFTQFALELNELTAELKRSLPSTDTRLRPDQRYLEEGNIQAAEAQKRRIEQLQRDRRRVMEENNIVHQARFFRRQTDSSGKEWWVTNNTYWRLRAEPGYGNLDGAVLW